jgi:hypothetical protein
MEKKAMLIEEIRARLVERADIVGQQEELEVIVEELKKSLMDKVTYFATLDEEYSRFVQTRRGYYEAARERESEMDGGRVGTGEMSLQANLSDELLRLNQDFAKVAEELLLKMETHDEDSYRHFGDYLEAQEKLRVVDEKMFNNISKVERDLLPLMKSQQEAERCSKNALDLKNLSMLQLIEEQERLASHSDEEDDIYTENKPTLSSAEKREYIKERDQLLADQDIFLKQKEAVLKRKACLTDELTKLVEKQKLGEAINRVREKSLKIQGLERELDNLQLEMVKLETDIVNASLVVDKKSRESSINLSSSRKCKIAKEKQTDKSSRRDSGSSKPLSTSKCPPKSFHSFLESLVKRKKASLRSSNQSSFLGHSKRPSSISSQGIAPKLYRQSSRVNTKQRVPLANDYQSHNYSGSTSKRNSSISNQENDTSLNQFSKLSLAYSRLNPPKAAQHFRTESNKRDYLMPTSTSRNDYSQLAKHNDEYAQYSERPEVEKVRKGGRGTIPESSDRDLKSNALWQKLNDTADPKYSEMYEKKKLFEALFEDEPSIIDKTPQKNDKNSLSPHKQSQNKSFQEKTPPTKQQLNRSLAGRVSMNKVPTHSEKLLSIRIPDRKDLDPCIEEVREKETSRFYTGQEMTPPPFPADESKTKRKHIQSFLSHMADMKNVKASSRGDSTKKLTVLSKSKSKLQLNSSSIQGKPSSKDLDLISQSHSAKLAPSVSASGQPNLRLPKQSTVSDDQTDLNTSQCRSALSNMRSASAANEFALPSSFFIYKKKLFSFGKKTLSFSPFNATTITPKLCGFEPFDAFCENGCVILLVDLYLTLAK